MSSQNIADSVLEDHVCTDGEPESDLEWDKENESFTEFFQRLVELAEEEVKTDTTLSERDLENIEGRVDQVMQEYAR